MRTSSLFVPLAALALIASAAVGCETEPKSVSLENKLTDLRTQRQEVLDRLYTEYGRGELAEAIKKETAEGAATKEDDSVGKEVLEAIGNAAGEADRAAFEAHCKTLGSGDRPAILSDRGKAFFDKPSTKKSCRALSTTNAMIEALEEQLDRAKAREE